MPLIGTIIPGWEMDFFYFFFCHALHLHQWDVTILHLSLVKSGVSEVCKNEINFKGQRF